jgi:hypothetical protein
MSKLNDKLVFKHYLWSSKSEFNPFKKETEPFSELKDYIVNNLNPVIDLDEANAFTVPLENLTERDIYLTSLLYTTLCLALAFITLMGLFAYMVIATGPYAILICFLFIPVALCISYWDFNNQRPLYETTRSIIDKNNQFLKDKGVKIVISEFDFWKGVSNEIKLVKYNL